ncbi:copper resistance protein B [Sphingomonas sp. 1P06PA]|uniref:copper resistance protein B n=1 Tax=Sphingomonas sp. 1P06PA TaxID=554121 RepID=UPI0039A70826
MASLAVALLAAQADPACAPEHAAMGHCTPRSAPKPAPRPAAAPVEPKASPAAADPACPPEHAAMGHCQPAPSARSPALPAVPASGTALPAGNAAAPAPPQANYADRIWGADAMRASRADLRHHHGGGSFSMISFNLAEYQLREGRDGFRWDGEGWFGSDLDRLTIKTEGDATRGRGIDEAEIQALYSRAIGPYFNLQAGVRQDFGPGPSPTHASIGFEGLAPYWFDVEGTLFLSDAGDVTARLEATYDQRITQRLILQPRAELNFAAQDIPATATGAGLSTAELGLRLRYEFAREFAPYVGISHDRSVGQTARYARAEGDDPVTTSLVLGIRFWF